MIAFNKCVSAEFCNGMQVDCIAPVHLKMCLDKKEFRRDLIWVTQDKFNNYARIDSETSSYGPTIYFASHIETDYDQSRVYKKNDGTSFSLEHSGEYYVYHEDKLKCLDAYYTNVKNVSLDGLIEEQVPGKIRLDQEILFFEQKNKVLLASERNLEEFLIYRPYGAELMENIENYNHKELNQNNISIFSYKYAGLGMPGNN
jgi:hypothetical protein